MGVVSMPNNNNFVRTAMYGQREIYCTQRGGGVRFTLLRESSVAYRSTCQINWVSLSTRESVCGAATYSISSFTPPPVEDKKKCGRQGSTPFDVLIILTLLHVHVWVWRPTPILIHRYYGRAVREGIHVPGVPSFLVDKSKTSW